MNYKNELKKIKTNSKKCGQNLCVYCGADQECYDHAVPLSHFDGDRRHARKLYYAQGWETMPSCRSCNSLAGTHFSESFEDRKKFISKGLKRRYRNSLNSPSWTKKELNSLTGILKKSVQEELEKADFVRARRDNLLSPLPIYQIK